VTAPGGARRLPLSAEQVVLGIMLENIRLEEDNTAGYILNQDLSGAIMGPSRP
jgi:hypothetical protein